MWVTSGLFVDRSVGQMGQQVRSIFNPDCKGACDSWLNIRLPPRSALNLYLRLHWI